MQSSWNTHGNQNVPLIEQAEMEAMKGSVTSKDLNLLSEQLGKDAVTRVHRLEMLHILERAVVELKFRCIVQ